ncbi:ATP cone domain-containing protein [Marinoscillum sp.]|uniref:ATP cone domain-containing protein n=1 Tax=Marinoscillum sp. TaxID=2024838 RepID=UPI003BA93246
MSSNPITIRKFSGETDTFDPEKLLKSLTEAGATTSQADKITQTIRSGLYNGISTKQIYQKAHRLLKNRAKEKASRYGLKKALLQLGPTGYPFELFIGELMKKEGYQVQVGQTMQGKCVTHEVDVLAVNDHAVRMMECKFHNRLGYKTDVKVPMYIKSRFEDLSAVWSSNKEFNARKHEGWVVTNARFTSDAADFGRCTGLHMMSWDHPTNSLKSLVTKYMLYPVTTIPGLSKNIKEQLFRQEIVLASSLATQPDILQHIGLEPSKIRHLVEEAKNICEL